MSDIDKERIQRDARRTVARRTITGSSPEQAILRRLGVELYRESHRTEATAQPEPTSPEEAEETTEKPT